MGLACGQNEREEVAKDGLDDPGKVDGSRQEDLQKFKAWEDWQQLEEDKVG